MTEGISVESSGHSTNNPPIVTKATEILVPQTHFLKIKPFRYALFWLLSVLKKINNSRNAIVAIEAGIWFAILSLIGPFTNIFECVYNIFDKSLEDSLPKDGFNAYEKALRAFNNPRYLNLYKLIPETPEFLLYIPTILLAIVGLCYIRYFFICFFAIQHASSKGIILRIVKAHPTLSYESYDMICCIWT